MNKLTKSDINRLHGIVNKTTDSTCMATNAIKSLHEDFGIGKRISKTHVKFDSNDKIKIINNIKNRFNLDLRVALEGDRTAFSNKSGNEKLATESPKEKNIEVRSLTGIVKINGIESHLFDPTISIVMNSEQLKSVEHTSIIIVENYVAFKKLSPSILPKHHDFADPLIAYRGDNTRSPIDGAIERLNTDTYSWMDYDPQGFNLAIAKREITKGTLLPSNPDILFSKNYGKKDVFNKQLRFVDGLKDKNIEWVNDHISIMTNKLMVLTQEGIIHSQQPLKLKNW
ncbi:hypothetical protein EN12_20100 [Vibrio cholerae]|nr:hypothetical protein EN12_20100 [Vibrio cholerae]